MSWFAIREAAIAEQQHFKFIFATPLIPWCPSFDRPVSRPRAWRLKEHFSKDAYFYKKEGRVCYTDLSLLGVTSHRALRPSSFFCFPIGPPLSCASSPCSLHLQNLVPLFWRAVLTGSGTGWLQTVWLLINLQHKIVL